MSNTDLKMSMPGEIKGKEIDLKNLFYVIKKRLWIIISITILLTFLSGVYSIFTFSPIYQTSARMMVKASGDQMNTLLVMMDEPIILKKVVEDLNLTRPPEVLSGQISVETVNGSQVVRISVIDSDPVMAAKIANATMYAYQSEIPKLIDFNEFDILATAKENPNLAPINDNFMRNVVLAFMAGMIISIGFVLLLDSLDETIKSEKELERLLGTPILGSIPKVKRKKMVKKMDDPEAAVGGGLRWLLARSNSLKS